MSFVFTLFFLFFFISLILFDFLVFRRFLFCHICRRWWWERTHFEFHSFIHIFLTFSKMKMMLLMKMMMAWWWWCWWLLFGGGHDDGFGHVMCWSSDWQYVYTFFNIYIHTYLYIVLICMYIIPLFINVLLSTLFSFCISFSLYVFINDFMRV